MISLIQKFNCTTENCDILHLPEVLNTIKVMFGENTYNDLINHKSTKIEVSAIFCDSPTKIMVNYTYGKDTIAQDLINNNVFMYPENYVAQIISTNKISGTIFLKVI